VQTLLQWKSSIIIIIGSTALGGPWPPRKSNNTYSESAFVALVIQQAMRMRPIMLSSVAIFPRYLINGMILGEKLVNKRCFDFLYNFHP
jgi:hypothetical protein